MKLGSFWKNICSNTGCQCCSLCSSDFLSHCLCFSFCRSSCNYLAIVSSDRKVSICGIDESSESVGGSLFSTCLLCLYPLHHSLFPFPFPFSSSSSFLFPFHHLLLLRFFSDSPSLSLREVSFLVIDS